MSNHLHAYLLEKDVYKQNNYQNGSNADSENTHRHVLRPFICYGRELVSFRSPTVTPPETACSCDTWSANPGSGSDYRMAMVLTLVVYLCMFRANRGQCPRLSKIAVMLVR